MLPLASLHVEASILLRNVMAHGAFKNMAVDKRHGWQRRSMKLKGNKWVVGSNNSNAHWLYRIKRVPPCHTSTSVTHILSIHDHNVSHHNNTSMIHASPSLPMHSFFHVSHLYVSPLLFGLHGSLIQPLWLWSILIEHSTQPRVLQEVSLLDGVDAGVCGNGRRFVKTSS